MFVSIISDAIPKKGSVHFEVDSATNCLLLYTGFASIKEFDALFPRFAVMFVTLCDGYDVDQGEPKWTRVATTLQSSLNLLRLQRDGIAKYRRQSEDFLVTMEKQLGMLFE